jgi:hypothetical protein
MSLKARCNYDGFCEGYPHNCHKCAIVEYVQNDVKITNMMICHTKEILKENKMKNMYVVVDGKAYRPIGGTIEHSIDTCCRVELEAYLTPVNEVALKPTIKDVIFNPPATIVFWSDDTKTVVKADDETYDPEKGIAMAISRKMIGDNKREYYNVFRHYLKKWEKQNPHTIDDYFVEGEY